MAKTRRTVYSSSLGAQTTADTFTHCVPGPESHRISCRELVYTSVIGCPEGGNSCKQQPNKQNGDTHPENLGNGYLPKNDYILEEENNFLLNLGKKNVGLHPSKSQCLPLVGPITSYR